MAGDRGGFVEREFTCALCGERFRALAGASTPAVVLCTHCGLRHSRTDVDRLLRERRAGPGKKRGS